MVQYKIFVCLTFIVLCEHWSKHSVPAFLFFFNQYMENILCHVCKYCFWHPHLCLLHNQLLFGTLTTVSLNCPGGTGVLCWRRKTFTDRAFQMVSAVNIAIEGESQPLCTYITKKCATHINSEAEMISKNSHMDWSAIAWDKSCEKSQCSTKRLDCSSTPWTLRQWMSLVNLSSCLWMKACAICPTKSWKYCWIGPCFFTHVFLSLGTSGALRRGTHHACANCACCLDGGDYHISLRVI